MPKKGENIYKRKDGRWEGRYIKAYRPDGKAQYSYVYGKTYTDAKQKLLAARIDHSKGKETKSRPALKQHRDCKDSHEYQDYLATPTRGNADAFISSIMELHGDAPQRDMYLKYIDERIT